MLLLSAFFSGSETGLMTMNRYRLRTRAQKGERAAKLAQDLIERPDQLIGWILLGNNVVQALAASITTVIGLRLFGEIGIAYAAGVVALLLLIFSEYIPKTLAAIYPERVGLPSAYVHWMLIRVFYPVVYLVNLASNGMLRLIGVSPEEAAQHSLSTEELRTVVAEAGAMIPHRHQKMLLSIL
ncbi:MAG TPA: CNNM domain-containing protein, partial [Solimonas sp.]|nr:CNNM domain-containing protein [Solimonas sp.]